MKLESKSLPAKGEAKGTVLLGHAMFNTYDYYFKPAGKSLADFLSQSGYNVVAFHLTGYGKSRKADKYTGFDQYVADYKEFLDQLNSNEDLFFIGHSVGGLAGISAIGKGSYNFKKIFLFAPAVWPFSESSKDRFIQRAKLRLMYELSKPFGKFPMNLLKLGNTHAPHGHFKQLFRWAKNNKVNSQDSAIEYTQIWKNIKCPVVVFEGSKDLEMATPNNVKWVLKNLSGDTQLNTISKVSEYNYDADHFGIIYGKNASSNVWPKLTEFMR